MGRIKDYYEQEIAGMRLKQALQSADSKDKTTTITTEKASQDWARNVKAERVLAKRNRKSVFSLPAELLRALTKPRDTPNQSIPDVHGIDAEDVLADAVIIRPTKKTAEGDSTALDNEAQQ